MNSNDMVFWDDMWNMSSTDKPKEDNVCCGEWDQDGICTCKKQQDKHT